jgi:hypothetical protein
MEKLSLDTSSTHMFEVVVDAIEGDRQDVVDVLCITKNNA